MMASDPDRDLGQTHYYGDDCDPPHVDPAAASRKLTAEEWNAIGTEGYDAETGTYHDHLWALTSTVNDQAHYRCLKCNATEVQPLKREPDKSGGVVPSGNLDRLPFNCDRVGCEHPAVWCDSRSDHSQHWHWCEEHGMFPIGGDDAR